MELQSQVTKVRQLLKCIGVVVAKVSTTKILAHFWYIIVLFEV